MTPGTFAVSEFLLRPAIPYVRKNKKTTALVIYFVYRPFSDAVGGLPWFNRQNVPQRVFEAVCAAQFAANAHRGRFGRKFVRLVFV